MQNAPRLIEKVFCSILKEDPRRQTLFIALTGLIFALCHIGLPLQTFPDTTTYLYLREHLNDPDIWRTFMQMRPPLLPLLYLAIPNQLGLCLFQSVLSFAAWLTLARFMSRSFTVPQVRTGIFYLVLWSAMGSNILFWNRVMLTESLTLSALCLFIAGWLRAFQSKHYLLMLGAGLALLLLRDSMIYLVLPMAASLLLWQRPVRLLAILLVLAGTTAVAAHWAQQGQRHVAPLINSIGQRVITSPAVVAYFRDHGMPVSPALMACAGKFDCPFPLETAQWAASEGKTVYMKWLLTSLPRRMVDMLNGRMYIAPGNILYPAYMTAPPNWLYKLASLPALAAPRYWLEAFALAGLILALRLRQHRIWRDFVTKKELSWLLLCSLALSNLFVSYWGDAMETVRHCLGPMMMLQLAMTGLAAALIEYRLRAGPCAPMVPAQEEESARG